MLSCQLNELVPIVVGGGFVAADGTAFTAFVCYDEPALGIGLGGDRVHDPAAVSRTVARVHVKVKGTQADGAVIAGGVSERCDLVSAVFANKGSVIFLKTFCFHNFSEKTVFC